LLETVLSNCTFDRGSLKPTYTSPFDLLVKGNETRNWRRGWDSNPRAGYPTTRFRGAPVTTTSVPLRRGKSAEADLSLYQRQPCPPTRLRASARPPLLARQAREQRRKGLRDERRNFVPT